MKYNEYFEESLKPIAYKDDNIIFFQTNERKIYRLSSGGYVECSELMQNRSFTLPGLDLIVSIPSDCKIKKLNIVDVFSFKENKTILTNVLNNSYLKYLIYSENGYCLLFSGEHSNKYYLTDSDFTIIGVYSLPGMAKPLLYINNRILFSSNLEWGLLSESGDISKFDGEIIDVGHAGVIFRLNSKDSRELFLYNKSGIQEIIAPPGWSINQACLYSDSFILSCTNSLKGYAIYDPVKDCMNCISGQLEIHSLGGKRPPLIRVSGSGIGSEWRNYPQSLKIKGFASSENSIGSKIFLLNKIYPCSLIYNRLHTKGLLVSFHGGPDSHEIDGLRYNSLYRDLAKSGFSTLIVNYPGSRGFGEKFQKKSWKNWNTTINELSSSIDRYITDNCIKNIIYFGVSFGSWISVKTCAFSRFNFPIVTLSPIYNLQNHIIDHNNKKEFLRWSNDRFDLYNEDFYPIDYNNMSITSIIPEEDEIVASEDIEIVKGISNSKIITVPGRHYPENSKTAEIRWNILYDTIVHIFKN